MKQIQWYPGHMAKGLRLMQENIKVVDLFIIVIDARVPMSSFNPNIEEITKNRNKEIMVLLNKKDLANDQETEKWLKVYEEKYDHSYAVNLKDRNDVAYIKKEAVRILDERDKNKKRIMVMGIPNVGKSTLINAFAGRKIVKEQNQPGITKHVTWSNIGNGLKMLDSPGILMPAYQEKRLSENLAYTNNIKLTVVPIEEVAYALITTLKERDLDLLNTYFKIDAKQEEETQEIIDEIGMRRGMNKKGVIDYNTLSFQIVKNFADGKMGKFTLETAEEYKDKIK